MSHWFFRSLLLDKEIIYFLIDKGGSQWALKVHRILSRSYQVDPYKFTAELINLVDDGKYHKAKAHVRRNLRDIEFRPWTYQVALFTLYPIHLLQRAWRKICEST